MLFLVLFKIYALLSVVWGHGNQVFPPTWFNPGGSIGTDPAINCDGVFSSCMWFTNHTFIPGQPTLDPSLWTYSKIFTDEMDPGATYLRMTDSQCLGHGQTYLDMESIVNHSPFVGDSNDIPPLTDYFAKHPWRSPGTSPVHSPCGVAGGNPQGCPATAPPGEGPICPGGGYGYGPPAQLFPFRDIVTTDWKIGTEVEVGWSIRANHGGGYSYRLCRLPVTGRADLTESCFQSTPLDFIGDTQWVQYGEDRNNRTEFRADRTRLGTYPPGSQWTKNPIPACAGGFGGFLDLDPNCSEGTQFPPHAKGLFGFGVHFDVKKKITIPGGAFHFTIIDRLLVPEDLDPGQYVLSFRWDCEQTSQVWSACSNINITTPSNQP